MDIGHEVRSISFKMTGFVMRVMDPTIILIIFLTSYFFLDRKINFHLYPSLSDKIFVRVNLDPLTPVFETDEDILNTYPYSDLF